MLDNSYLERKCLRINYFYGVMIEESKSAIAKRLYSLAIPLLCSLSETVKLASDSARLAKFTFRLLSRGKMQSGNKQNAIMHLCEHLRNLLGITLGAVVGIYSPQLARNSFLTANQTQLHASLNSEKAALLYATTKALKDFFERHHIDYRICSGAMLGAVRQQGIIPWDDDVDISLHPDSVQKCSILFEDGSFKKETGLEVRKQDFTSGWQCFHPFCKEKSSGILQGIALPFVDVFSTEFREDKIIFSSKTMRLLSSEDYFTKKEWEEFTYYDFGPLRLKGSMHAHEYLRRAYSPDYLNFAYQTLPHKALVKIEEKWKDPYSIYKLIRKYGFPRRVYLADSSPLDYNAFIFYAVSRQIDKRVASVFQNQVA